MKVMPERRKVKNFVRDLEVWYRQHGRHGLPWRYQNKKINPYGVLVSEIMLQQTQVVRVYDKWILWMKRYPTLRKLKAANLSEVLKLWQGLGYQRRAKALYMIGQQCDTLSSDYDTMVSLSGIGDYTARAVRVFAFSIPDVPIETNIRTVLVHHFCSDKQYVTDEALQELLVIIIQKTKLSVRDLYYALMDYGAFLKGSKISYNHTDKKYRKQSTFKGSRRETRAKVLFAITHGEPIPRDRVTREILRELEKEGFIKSVKNTRVKSNVYWQVV